jgi:beta-galactosidase/beta-glucuronidase
VDWEASVWVNDQMVGTHRGGQLPFSFDITKTLQPGENQVVVSVWDPTDRSWVARGKQVLKPSGIWYTAVSGIWGTVWLEPVPHTSIESLKITPDIDTESLEIWVNLAGPATGTQVVATAFDGRTQVGVVSGRTNTPLKMSIPNPKLWSPAHPHLYDLQVAVYQQGQALDQVSSYFGMRLFSLEADAWGRPRFCLNHQPLFLYGPLDQGYWPDGLYTPPTEEAMRSDLVFLKRMGCNLVRKHIKVEPARYYYDCDRMGLIVWQDMVNGGKAVGPVLSYLAIMFNKLKRVDNRFYWRAGRGRRKSRQDYHRELQEMVDHLHNFACIGTWVPFNEAWGQFDAKKVADWLKSYDPSRLVDHASGWFDQGAGDFRSIHTYFKALAPEPAGPTRGVVLSEFGGYALKLPGHVWDPETEFGYRKYETSQELTEAYIDLLETQLKPWVEQGLSGAIYTQTTDVETEINGYLTYDREVVKMDTERLKEAHADLMAASPAAALPAPPEPKASFTPRYDRRDL